MLVDRLFSSDQLIYRALDYTAKAKEHFLNMMLNDPTTFGQSTNRL
jgi:hypothetical protein